MTRALERHFDGRGVVFIYLQTTFEGHSSNTFARARAQKRKYKIPGPVGHDGKIRGRRPYTMALYRTGGTPWTIVIDRGGRIRFNDFTRGYRFHRQLIGKLLAKPTGS